MGNMSRFVTIVGVATCLSSTGKDTLAGQAPSVPTAAVERVLKALNSTEVDERAQAVARIESSAILREADRVRGELIAALDRANREYFASWEDDAPAYTEAQGEIRLALLDAVIALKDARAIPVLVDAVDTGNDAHRALAAFGGAAVSHVFDAYAGGAYAEADDHLGLQRFMLLNTMKLMVADGRIDGAARERIAGVVRELLTSPGESGSNDAWTVMGGMDLARALDDPALVNRVEEIARKPEEARRLGIAGADESARVSRYAAQVVGSGETIASESGFTPVTDAMLQDPAPGDWLMWRRTLDGWGYSPLDRIDRGNVGRLRMVWSRGLGPGLQQGTPLVYGGVLYMPNPRDVIQALDAATGDLLWEHRRDRPDDLEDYMLGVLTDLNRNLAIHGRHVIDTSGDDYVFALDAVTGELAWETEILDYRVNPANQSSGPIVAGGRIISGRGCTPRGGPDACVIAAHDAATGEELWRRRTIPAPGEPGDESWGAVPFEERKHVGAWMVPSYDPELNLVYVGTSVTSPAPKFLLGGADLKHLYHNSTLALAADTGEIVWHYQHLNDSWDLDHPFERLLVDTVVRPDPSAVEWINPRLVPGERRRVMTGIPGKTGIVYTLDRATGEFLWATPTIAQNVVAGIDGATGAVSENAEVVFRAEGQEVFACPTLVGGKDWEAGAYSPLTNAMYFPLRNACARLMATDDGSLYGLGVRSQTAPGTDQVGTVQAISAETGAVLWKHEQRAATSSLVATGGGLVFGGDHNGRFRAFDHETGEVLWEINLGSPLTGFPITYAVDGRQYVAVSTGTSLTSGAFNRLTPELRPSAGNTLFVFALPE